MRAVTISREYGSGGGEIARRLAERLRKDAHLYDLVINTSILDLNGAVELIYLALQLKATRLTVPEHELGPATGTPRYPGVPGDLRPSGQ